MNIKLRQYKYSDFQKVTEWWNKQHCQENMSRYLPRKYKENIDEWLMYIITYDDIEIGSIWIEYNDQYKQYDLGIMIGDEQYLSKGVGKQAILLAINETKDIFNYSSLYLNIRQNNIRALKCYESIGFKIISELERTYSEINETIKAYRMEYII